ncbi:MAG: hypothetical protein J6X61_00375 [Clostridia bacterium]|nr:hypothetical protein [Clostridia bacterium]
MKRVSVLVLALALLLTACTGAPTGDSSKAASSRKDASIGASSLTETSVADASADASEVASSRTISSQGASSLAVSSQSGVTVIENGNVVTINALNGTNISQYIPAVCKGKAFVINGGSEDNPLLLDKAPLLRLYDSGASVSGNGFVKWSSIGSPGALSNSYLNPHRFTGIIPMSKFNDPIFMSTALPSEAPTIMSWRTRASNMYPTQKGHENALAIGAIYPNTDTTIPDDATITICLRNITLLLHTPGKGWIQGDKQKIPSRDMVRHVYYLPWGNGQYSLPDSQITFPGTSTGWWSQSTANATHVEIKLTGADFNGKGSGAGSKATSACLHFWGNNAYFSNLGVTATDIDGFVSAYEVWVKEPEVAGKLVAAIAVDLRPSKVPQSVDNDSGVDQNYSGRNYKLTNEPRWAIGHSVGNDVYDAIMDSEKVQKLIGLK